MKTLISKLYRDEEGQGLVEYALIASLIAIAAIVALTFLGGRIGNLMNTVGNTLQSIENMNKIKTRIGYSAVRVFFE